MYFLYFYVNKILTLQSGYKNKIKSKVYVYNGCNKRRKCG